MRKELKEQQNFLETYRMDSILRTRIKRLIFQSVELLKINLSGKTILTEVGSGLFVVSPIIALMAGAKQVFVWSKDSSFGKAESNIKLCKELIKEFGLDLSRIEFSKNERPINHIKKADIITNLGFIRPIDKSFILNMKPSAVIPLMCEAWEVRKGDVDLDYCKKKGIRIAGTWENHPKLKIFDGCGYLAAKMAFEAGFEIYQNNIVIYSPDHFGEVIYKAFKRFKPNKLVLIKDETTLNKMKFNGVDFLFIADYTSNYDLIGKNGMLNTNLFKDITVIHLSGQVNLAYCKQNEIEIYPIVNGYSKRMTRTLSHLGPRSIIFLHAAGFKVGELMLKKSKDKLVQYL